MSEYDVYLKLKKSQEQLDRIASVLEHLTGALLQAQIEYKHGELCPFCKLAPARAQVPIAFSR